MAFPKDTFVVRDLSEDRILYRVRELVDLMVFAHERRRDLLGLGVSPANLPAYSYMRAAAIARGMKLSQLGCFYGDSNLASTLDERSVYALLGVPYKEPCDR